MAGSTSRALVPLLDTGQDHDVQPSTPEFISRKKVSLACLACRRRRTKCDGGVPCASCLSRNTECIKDENDDGRRKLAVKRRLEILEKDRHFLDDLLRALRTTGPKELNALVNMIRADAGRQEIKTFLHDGFTRLGEFDEQDRRQETYRKHRHMLGRIEDVVNPPIQVPAKPWTTVTDDDDLVSHLMSLWFTWAHPWWHWVDEKQFIVAMQAGDPSSLICTPYLVNMILTDACLLDTLADDGSEPNLELREQFYNEGKRGLEAQEGHISLAYVAALGVQWTYLNTNGQDKIGNAILYQQIYLSKSLSKWRAKLEHDPKTTPENLHVVDISLDRFEWTLYTLNLFVGLALEQIRLFPRPTRGKPGGDFSRSCEDRGDWTPYPVPYTAIDWHPNCHYLAFVSLAEKATEDEALFVEKQQQDTEEAIQRFEKLYKEVEEWPQTLPPCMRMHEKAMPHVIALHALYSWAIVTMSKQNAALDAGNSTMPSLVYTPQSTEHDRWKEVSVSASKHTADLLELIRLNWGADHFPVIIMQPATIAAFALLEDLEHHPESQEAFYKLCITIRAASRRFRVNRGVLRLLKKKAKENHIALPEGCDQLLADFNIAMDVDEGSVAVTDDIGLEFLLEKWDDLDLDDV